MSVNIAFLVHGESAYRYISIRGIPCFVIFTANGYKNRTPDIPWEKLAAILLFKLFAPTRYRFLNFRISRIRINLLSKPFTEGGTKLTHFFCLLYKDSKF